MQSKQTLQVAALTLIAIGLLAVIFYTPVWWVSLTAPNYPEESFPDGVRIHFHMNGVFNGCEKQQKTEITEEEALDCVHEMDTINHYVGMYPIAAGGPVERAFSQFLMAFMGIMLVGFMFPNPKLRMAVLGIGFLGIAAWMGYTLYGVDGFRLQSAGYVTALVTSLDQEAGEERAEPEIVIGGVTGALKQSLEDSGVEVILPSQLEAQKRAKSKHAGIDKSNLIKQLKTTYDIDQAKSDTLEPWDGSTFQIMSWHYAKSLGRYFNNPAEIVPMVANLQLAVNVVFVGLLAAMVLVIWGSRRNGGLLYWLLVLVPIALPVFFVIDYSAWLWWYGHTLNDMGAFSVKPFMPTVFGDGKVAQFTTHSYPYIGFGLMLLTSVVLAVAALLRFRQFKQGGSD
ncbi:MAG: hypothetical protein P8103_09715 [Candidatus Thiodiazotropha sp.]